MWLLKGYILLVLVNISLSYSHYCAEHFSCYADCCQSDESYLWDCEPYGFSGVTCLVQCTRTVCCTGYEGDDCDIPTSCEEVASLPGLERRARNYQADDILGSDPYVDDQLLQLNWYRPTSENEQYLLPDSNYIPEPKFCGTMNPIYIKGGHPNITQLTEDPVQVTTCEYNDIDECATERTIEIRKCDEDVVYYLSPTNQDAAYCFDPPSIQEVMEFNAPTYIVLGRFRVQPKMTFEGEYLLPSLVFHCAEEINTMTPNRDDAYIYTYWFIDSDLVFTFENIGTIQSLTEDDLISEAYGLGINIRCGVRVATSRAGLKTQMVSSDDFFAGIKVENTTVYIDKKNSAEIKLAPTVPYGCYGTSTADCTLRIVTVYPNSHGATCNGGGLSDTYHEGQHARCSAEFKGYKADEIEWIPAEMTETETMTLSAPYFSDSDPDFFRVLFQESGNQGHKIWKKYKAPEAEIHVNNDNKYKMQLCYSHVDPHIKTPDGTYYDNHITGSYILYNNTKYNIMVQEKTTRCNRNRASCACAVAIRAGGDVFLIDLCNGKKFIGMTSCEVSGVLVVQKYSEFDYKVQTNIGTLVSIRIRPHRGYENLMNIDIHMAPKDYTSTGGLCGTFDSNRGNDYTDRSGNVVEMETFVNSWRLQPSDDNLLEATCSHSLRTWEGQILQMYCRCSCYDEDCPTVSQNVACSPSPYFNCTFSRQKTDLCQEFHERCTRPIRRRRSFSTHHEQELREKSKRLLSRHRKSEREIQKRSTDAITREMAEEMCYNAIMNSFIYIHFSNMSGGFNHTLAVQECSFDVFEGQDAGWTDAYETALIDAIVVGFRRDEDYSLAHQDDLKTFNKHSCPFSCSGHGTCTDDGICVCDAGFFGPDCNNSRSKGPEIEDVEAGGLCDVSYGSECRLVELQTDYLYENFWCRGVEKRRKINGELETIRTEIVEGLFKYIFAGECSFSENRQTRSINESTDSETMNYEYDVSLSNDGTNFGPTVTLYIFDSQCQNTIIHADGTVSIELKADTCLTNGVCLNQEEVAIDNSCFKCKPEVNQFALTNDCEYSGQTLDLHLILVIATAVTVTCFALAIVLVWLAKRACKRNRSVSAPSETEVYRINFNAKIQYKKDRHCDIPEKY